MKTVVLAATPAAALFVIALGTVTPAKAGLVGYYQFNNSAKLGVDSSGLGNDLASFGSGVAYSASGLSGGALSLSGQGDLSTVSGMVPSAFPTGNSAYTLAVSFSAASIGSAMGFLGWGDYGSTNQVDAFRLGGGGSDGTLVNYWWGGDLRTSPTIGANTWYTAVVSFDGTTRDMYLNGGLVGSDAPIGHAASGNNFAIGVTNNTEFFNGLLDDVAIFDDALTPAQAAAAEQATAVPEPASTLTFAVGLTTLALFRRRTRTEAWRIVRSLRAPVQIPRV